MPDISVFKGDHLKAAAAEIGNKPGRIRNVQRQTARDVMRFLQLAENIDGLPEYGLRGTGEFNGVLCSPDRGRRDGVDCRDIHRFHDA